MQLTLLGFLGISLVLIGMAHLPSLPSQGNTRTAVWHGFLVGRAAPGSPLGQGGCRPGAAPGRTVHFNKQQQQQTVPSEGPFLSEWGLLG